MPNSGYLFHPLSRALFAALMFGSNVALAVTPVAPPTTAPTTTPSATPTPSPTPAYVPETDCLSWMASPLASNGFFGAGPDSLWLLARRPSGSPSATAGADELQLFQVGLASESVRRYIGLNHKGFSAVIPHGNPPMGLTIFAADGWENQCPPAMARLTLVPLAGGAKGAVAKSTGPFAPVIGGTGYIFDTKSNVLQEVDPVSLQRKVSLKVPTDRRVLAADLGTGRYVTWDRKGRVARLWRRGNSRPLAEVGLGANDKMIFDGVRAAIIRLDAKANAIELREIKDWTGSGNPAIARFDLPPDTPVDGAFFGADFRTRRLLIYPGTEAARATWKRVYLYEYPSKSAPLWVAKLPDRAKVGHAAITPDGETAVFELRDRSSARAIGVGVASFTYHEWKEVAL